MRTLSILLLTALLLATPTLYTPIFASQDYPTDKSFWTLENTENFYFYEKDGDDTKNILWRQANYYKNELPDGQLWMMGEHIIFGELVLRAYGLNDKDGNLIKSWVQVEKDGKWFTEKDGEIYGEPIMDAAGKIVGVRLVLFDAQGKEVVTRDINRK